MRRPARACVPGHGYAGGDENPPREGALVYWCECAPQCVLCVIVGHLMCVDSIQGDG